MAAFRELTPERFTARAIVLLTWSISAMVLSTTAFWGKDSIMYLSTRKLLPAFASSTIFTAVELISNPSTDFDLFEKMPNVFLWNQLDMLF